jgi:shikimate 5-dehydrogenase
MASLIFYFQGHPDFSVNPSFAINIVPCRKNFKSYPVGMALAPHPARLLKKDMVVFDSVYNPMETRLL